jgi:hypothetical protein
MRLAITSISVVGSCKIIFMASCPEIRRRPTRRQLHVWLDEEDYMFILNLASQRRDTVSGLMRRVIRHWRHPDKLDPDRRSGAAAVTSS